MNEELTHVSESKKSCPVCGADQPQELDACWLCCAAIVVNGSEPALLDNGLLLKRRARHDDI